MYVGVDIGGSKTLVACLDRNGVITEQQKCPTAANYDEFLAHLARTVDEFTTKEYRAAVVAVPGRINREHGIGEAFGNLPWHNVHLATDIEKILHCPVLLEHDPSLAALSEAMLLKDQFSKVLYVTVSTGIGAGLVVDQEIDEAFADSEVGQILLEHNGEMLPWEKFASGKAIVATYGKRAADIDDGRIWQAIARNIAKGLRELLALTEPEVVVIGGSIGTYFAHYEKYLVSTLKRHEVPLVPIPPIRAAGRPEEAVVYGCYDLARSKHGSVHSKD
jgi:predicted NBD/HSP70 family sugar kinase